MALQRWDPVRDLLGLQENLNRLFEDALARSGSGPAEIALGTGWRPATDLFEEPERYVARLDLPGVLPADVTVEIEGDAVAIRGERRPDPGVPREAYLRAERPQGRFVVALALPASVDRDAVEAKHVEGVLEIVLPKKHAERPTRVKVEIG